MICFNQTHVYTHMLFHTLYKVLFKSDAIQNTLRRHNRGHRGPDRTVVGFTTTYAVSAYH
jgi:hypothetical protein